MWCDQLTPASAAMADCNRHLQTKINSYFLHFFLQGILLRRLEKKEHGCHTALSYGTQDNKAHNSMVNLCKKVLPHILHTTLLPIARSEYKRTSYSLHTYNLLNSSPPKFPASHPHHLEHGCIIIPVYYKEIMTQRFCSQYDQITIRGKGVVLIESFLPILITSPGTIKFNVHVKSNRLTERWSIGHTV